MLRYLMSSFGFHFILVTNISENLSAKYSESDDTNEDYTVKLMMLLTMPTMIMKNLSNTN